MRYKIFNKKTRELYREACPVDGKMEVVHFDSRTIAEEYLPLHYNGHGKKSCSIIDLKNRSSFLYPPLFSKNHGLWTVFNRHGGHGKKGDYFLQNMSASWGKFHWLRGHITGTTKHPVFLIVGVFDDRQSVVDMWRQNGITCFQVAKGDF